MKIRSGFVSNSSSSSFIVVFPKVPKSKEDVQKILFNGHKYFNHPYDDIKYTAEQVSETVWDAITKQTHNDREMILEAMNGYIPPGFPEIPPWEQYRNLSEEEKSKMWDEYYKKINREIIKKTNELLKNIKKKAIYCFDFGDENGHYDSALEHGKLFRNLRHIIIDHH